MISSKEPSTQRKLIKSSSQVSLLKGNIQENNSIFNIENNSSQMFDYEDLQDFIELKIFKWDQNLEKKNLKKIQSHLHKIELNENQINELLNNLKLKTNNFTHTINSTQFQSFFESFIQTQSRFDQNTFSSLLKVILNQIAHKKSTVIFEFLKKLLTNVGTVCFLNLYFNYYD